MTNQLIGIYPSDFIEEDKLTSAFIICIYQNKLLLGYNNWRKQWEVPAGKREPGETITKTANREFFEETHHQICKLEFKCIAKIKDKELNYRYRAIFMAKIDKYQGFKKEQNDEMDELTLVNLSELDYLDIDKGDFEILKRLEIVL